MHSERPKTQTAIRLRRGLRGRPPRVPHPESVGLLERQQRCFTLHINGYSNVRIATALQINRETVALDIQMEGQRRAQERRLRVNPLVDMEKSIAVYQGVIARCYERIEEARRRAAGEYDEEGNVVRAPEPRGTRGCFMEDATIVKAQRAVDEITGLCAAYRTLVPQVPRPGPSIVDIINALPPDVRLDVIKRANSRPTLAGNEGA